MNGDPPQNKRLKYDYPEKWYLHKPESVLENETHIILWDFQIQMNYPLSTRLSDLVFINKKIIEKNSQSV